MDGDEGGPRAAAPGGAWVFAGGLLRSPGAEVAPFSIDFFARWTFARFLDDRRLALGFESSQPWSEGGSYGDRYGGVQVLERDGATWTPVALEFDVRRHDESFVPDDVVWHPRGALAWLRGGALYVQVLARPRGPIAYDLLPPRDSDGELALSFDAFGAWRALALDADGRTLTATDADGADVFDLELRRRARDGGAWAPIEVWSG